jgi:hypothetical protein
MMGAGRWPPRAAATARELERHRARKRCVLQAGAVCPDAPRYQARADLNNTNNRPQAFSACSWL